MTIPPRARRLRAAAVVACSALLLLAGCEAGPHAATPVAGKAPATSEPVATRVDWKTAAYAALDCAPRDAWVAGGLPGELWDAETVRRSVADVTGDGADEVLVQLGCPSAVSTPAERVAVFDVRGSAPRLIGVLGEELFLTRAAVTADGTTVELTGPTVAGTDPYCCPGHTGSVTYAWDGALFVVRSLTETPAAPDVRAAS
ncbi:LppP/LprE family lipoprotein [Blastococcus sp. TML/M2B]|uniref:LppP/LprE family lipoprotein n=1 Tax=unclassified Blastococcus TaxID=2619396 RepID=UPI00190C04AD|nr:MULTISPECIES: LppP/LprE family lipoprotein [unclassified Blastococcus]MBN1091768.1 LppP/LprE family lipoprotein [Blastococcus sp. TML/M2B]MBN1094676.1 LppP/LprE family lipoprotein [Blastococcus sp. TML/C7B]